MRKDVLKLRSIATCNLTHKAAKIPHVKLDIRKLSNNQSPTVSPNVIRSLHLNTHKQPSHAKIRKPSRSVTKLSHLKARNAAHQKLHHDRGVDTKNVSANHLRYKSNHLWWKYHVKKKKNFSSYLCEFLLLLIFFTNNFDFICNNNKQLYFVKMHPTMPSEHFFVSNSINKFIKVTTRDKQLLKLSKTCSILINLSSVYVNPNFLYKKKDRFTWFQIAAIVWFLSLTLSKTKVLCRYLRIFIHFSLIFGKLMIASIVLFIYIYILNKIVLNFKVFKLMAFLAFFVFLFSLLNANFIHTNIFLCTNSYNNFVTRGLCLRNGLAGINHSVQWENKLTLLHKNFEFSKNAVRNSNFILGYTMFTLILIILKSFKKKSRQNFSFYSIIFLTLIILKPALESTNSDLQSQLRKCFTKYFFYGRSPRSMLPFTRFISSLPRLPFCHFCIEIQKLL